MRKLLCLLSALCLSAAAALSEAHADDVRFEFRTNASSLSHDDLMESFGFSRAQGRLSEGNSIVRAGPDGLTIGTRRRAFSLWTNSFSGQRAAQRLRIDWRVDQYPERANWDRGVQDNALMVLVFYGTENYGSGLFFLPESPYFIGFFLCGANQATPGRVYTGRIYQRQGRYICVDNPVAGASVISDIDLTRSFERAFGRPAPPVSGLGITVSTMSSNPPSSATLASMVMESN